MVTAVDWKGRTRPRVTPPEARQRNRRLPSPSRVHNGAAPHCDPRLPSGRPRPHRESLKRQNTRSADDILPCVSWPLPAIQQRIRPVCRFEIAVRIASARSPISFAPLAWPKIAERITFRIFTARVVVGDDEHDRHSRRRIAPNQGALALARSRSPARTPNTTTSLRLAVKARNALQTLSQSRVRLVRIIDENRRRHCARTELAASRPFAPSRCFGALRNTCAGSLPVPIASPAEMSAFSIWNSPTSGNRIAYMDARDARDRNLCAKPSNRGPPDQTNALAWRHRPLPADCHDPQCRAGRAVIDHGLRTIMIGPRSPAAAIRRDKIAVQPEFSRAR